MDISQFEMIIVSASADGRHLKTACRQEKCFRQFTQNTLSLVSICGNVVPLLEIVGLPESYKPVDCLKSSTGACMTSDICFHCF